MVLDNYMKEMAENCYQTYRDMTGKSPVGINIKKLEPPFSITSYKTAIVIPYENREVNFEGRFILGFKDELMAIKLAGTIANHAGMPAVDQMDDMATDILKEFMNTVAGRVISEWDKIGMSADFFTPEYVADLNFDDCRGGEQIVHTVTLSLEKNEELTFLTSLHENEKSKLNDKKLLVVDDSKMIRFLLATEFEGHGCQVSQAENGLEGFIKTQSTQPDLIIMDLVMPKMGGLEAIAKIREINPIVPIIVLTSTSKKEEVIAAAAHKIKGYIKKPIKMDQLVKLALSCFQ